MPMVTIVGFLISNVDIIKCNAFIQYFMCERIIDVTCALFCTCFKV